MRALDVDKKIQLCKKLADNLPTLRAKASLSQVGLANKLGFTRQTINALENGKRIMQWSTFVAIVLFFSKEDEIKPLMSVLGILDEYVKETLDLD